MTFSARDLPALPVPPPADLTVDTLLEYAVVLDSYLEPDTPALPAPSQMLAAFEALVSGDDPWTLAQVAWTLTVWARANTLDIADMLVWTEDERTYMPAELADVQAAYAMAVEESQKAPSVRMAVDLIGSHLASHLAARRG